MICGFGTIRGKHRCMMHFGLRSHVLNLLTILLTKIVIWCSLGMGEITRLWIMHPKIFGSFGLTTFVRKTCQPLFQSELSSTKLYRQSWAWPRRPLWNKTTFNATPRILDKFLHAHGSGWGPTCYDGQETSINILGSQSVRWQSYLMVTLCTLEGEQLAFTSSSHLQNGKSFPVSMVYNLYLRWAIGVLKFLQVFPG